MIGDDDHKYICEPVAEFVINNGIDSLSRDEDLTFVLIDD
jgi:hypothetical protein